MKKPEETVILIDIDDTLNNLCETWCGVLNAMYSRNVLYEDVDEWDMRKFYPGLTIEQIREPLTYPEFWKKPLPKPHSQEKVEALVTEGYRVYLVTATDYRNVKPKYEYFVQRYFPAMDFEHMIVAHNKQLLHGDYMIDDGPHNLESGTYRKILMTAPHNASYNADVAGMIRAKNWNEIYDYIHSDCFEGE